MKKSISLFAILSSLTFAWPVSAADNDWKELSGLAFQTIDSDGNESVTLSEFSNFGEGVFVSMDGDGSGSLSFGEFFNWGFGMHNAAEDTGKSDAFKTSMRVVYALWDRDADNQVTVSEYKQSLDFEFIRADLDRDRSLTEEEYLAGFSIVVAAQAAIHPQSISN